MNIGELFVSVGVRQTDAFKSLARNFAQIGKAADLAMNQIGQSAGKSATAFDRLAAAIFSSNKGITSSFGNMASSAEAAANRVARAMAQEVEAVRAANIAMRSRGGGGAVGRGFFVDPFGDGPDRRVPTQRLQRTAPRNPIMNALQDDLRIFGNPDVAQTTSRGSWTAARAAATAGTANREYVAEAGPDMVHGSALGSSLGPGRNFEGTMETPTKRPGFVGRFRSALAQRRGGGGGGGGRSGGGFGGRNAGAGGGIFGEAAGVRRVILGAGLYQGAQGFGQLADTYTQLQMRLDGLTGSHEKSAQTFARLRDIAKTTNSSLEATTEGYVRIRHATAEMNLSEEDSFKLMTNLNTMLVTSGASTAEAASGMRQLTQAFAKGKLDGDEFKSIAENMPNILKALSKQTGKTEGQLRAMSEGGQLSRKMLVNMLLNVKDLQKPVDTFSSQWQKFKDDMMISFGVFTKENNLVEHFGTVLKYVGEILNDYVLPGLAATFKWLKEHETVTKILVGLGLASMFWGVAKALLGFPLGILTKIVGLYKLLANYGGAAGAAMAGAGGAGAGAGAAAKGKGGLGKMATLATLGLPGILAAVGYGANELTGGLGETAGPWSSAAGILGGMKDFEKGSLADRFNQRSVNIDKIDVNIQANDMTDAQQKFGAELEGALRHAQAGAGG